MTFVGRRCGGLVKANATQVSTPRTSTNIVISDTSRSDANGLNVEQRRTLLNILNNANIEAIKKLNSKCSSIQGIINTDASHHMIGRLDCLSHVRDITDCPVGLPNGKQTVVQQKKQWC